MLGCPPAVPPVPVHARAGYWLTFLLEGQYPSRCSTS